MFFRQIFNMLKKLSKHYYKIHLNSDFRKDLDWWANYAKYFNGKEKITGKFSPIYSVYTDASNWGYGAVFDSDWIIGSFHENDTLVTSPVLSHHFLPLEDWIYKAHINTKEMWAVWEAVSAWGQLWMDSTILFITDNNTVQSALSTRKSSSKEIMLLLRCIFWFVCIL